MNRLVRSTLIFLGTFFVALGLIGVFLPLLPTTPFLLLAAACYARASRRCYDWLLGNRWFGKYVRDYLEGRGIPPKTKIFSLFLLWLTVGYSVFLIHVLAGKVILIIVAVGVTLHILSIKTMRK